MKKNLLILLFILLFGLQAQAEDLCEFFKYCPGSAQRNGGKSLPSAIISGSLNPATLSKVKGLGLEAVFLSHNETGIGFVTGTGKVGALISASQENSFFGNRSIELEFDSFKRHEDKKRYQNNKYSFAAGFGLYNKKDLALDVGVSGIYNKDTGRFNPGAGVSGNLSVFTFGYSIYRDDTKITFGNQFDLRTGMAYSILYNSPTYEEAFTGHAYMLGVRFGSLFFDYILLKTKYKFYPEDTQIKIYSGSYNYKKILFNLAFRQEKSPNFKYKDGMLFNEREKESWYFGTQYSLNKHFLLGAAYNRYLIGDISASVTLSF